MNDLCIISELHKDFGVKNPNPLDSTIPEPKPLDSTLPDTSANSAERLSSEDGKKTNKVDGTESMAKTDLEDLLSQLYNDDKSEEPTSSVG